MTVRSSDGDALDELLEERASSGAYFLLINATPWALIKSYSHSYQMKTWDCPQNISPGTSTRIFMEGTGRPDDGAECRYTINDLNPAAFEIRYHQKFGATPFIPGVHVVFMGLETLHNPDGTTLTLEWRRDNNMPFVLASSELHPSNPSAQIVSSNPPQDWMHATYSRISCLSLCELSMPGTHDSGMSVFSGGSGLGLPINTLTQELNIREQLQFGARWFDIRPVIAGGNWKTGHYSFHDGTDAWHGGNGEEIRSIVDGINDFTANNKELVILKLSHGLNTDTFAGDKDNHLSQAEWARLLTFLEGINNRVINRGSTPDLSRLRVSDFISDNRAAVVIVVDDVVDSRGTRVQISAAAADKGFFQPGQLPLYDSYANTNNQDGMISDQLGKMARQRPNPTADMFLLSWTLTQSGLSIIDNAKGANYALEEKLWPAMSPSSYPNVIDVDAYPRRGDVAALSMAINYHFARTC
ncbi:PLC-like phosphodiesterase [Podospora didyma]|uniref:PLC-like phosphodiesterase n=1 Tax=Podospora didyma TaxID=330526 RepID=A0AAE0NUA0_9PEZI|nr:PLC-like phosphodiesterase [Podospora didyma]